jgi:hypothetical protein
MIALTAISFMVLVLFALAVDGTQRSLERRSYERHRND